MDNKLDNDLFEDMECFDSDAVKTNPKNKDDKEIILNVYPGLIFNIQDKNYSVALQVLNAHHRRSILRSTVTASCLALGTLFSVLYFSLDVASAYGCAIALLCGIGNAAFGCLAICFVTSDSVFKGFGLWYYSKPLLIRILVIMTSVLLVNAASIFAMYFARRGECAL